MKHMLAETYTRSVKLPHRFFCQPKIDGVRVFVNTVTGKMTSRDGNDIRVDHITNAVKRIGEHVNVILDGELYIHGLEFGDVLSAIKSRKNPRHKQVVLMVFDAVLPVKFSQRKEIYEQIIDIINDSHVQTVPSYLITPHEYNLYHKTFVENGFEGSMIRKDGMSYQDSRTWNLIKRKDYYDMDCRIIGFEPEKSGSVIKNTLGAMVLLTPAGVKFTAVPKVTLVERKRIWDNQDKWLGKVVVVKYLQLFKSGKPRSPNVKGLRYEQEII